MHFKLSSALVFTPGHRAVGLLTVTLRGAGRPFVHFDHFIASADDPLDVPDWLEANLSENGPIACTADPLCRHHAIIRPRDHPMVARLQSADRRRLVIVHMNQAIEATREGLAIAAGQLWKAWAKEHGADIACSSAVHHWLEKWMPRPQEPVPAPANDNTALVVPVGQAGAMLGLRPLQACFVARASIKPGYREHSSRTACELYAYMHRMRVRNPSGPAHDFTPRGSGDVVASIPFYPESARPRAMLELWSDCDREAAKFGETGISSLHVVADLPRGDIFIWLPMVRAFVEAQLLPLGLPVEAVIHEPARKGEAANPHVHFQIGVRTLDEQGRPQAFRRKLCSPKAWKKWQSGWESLVHADLKTRLARLIAA